MLKMPRTTVCDRTSRVPRQLYIVCVSLVVLSCISSIETLTTFGKTSQSNIQPFSNTGRTGTKGRRVMEPAFENAGRVQGLEIWRIENFKPVAYPKNDYGKFYSGDSYILLYTKNRNGVLSWDIHFWLGKETSQDEAGTAAILSVQLDDQLGGGPVQYREVQNHESQLFLSHFKSGVRYLPGGISSGFTQVDRNAFEKRLFQVKGKRNIRVKQVDITIASMNKGDCFILDVGKTIYVYVGTASKRVERLKAISAANQIRDQDHGGRAKVLIIDESSTDNEVEEFFNNLGGGSPSDVPDESAGESDDEFESDEEKAVTLYRVSDSTGRIQIQPIGTKPLQQSALDTNDCFILDTGGANIYVWVGKRCNNKEKSESMAKAQEFITTKNYPAWTRVQRIVENGEPSVFQQYFQTWKTRSELHTRLIRSAGEERQPTRLEAKSAGEAPEFMPDDGSGDLEIFRIENFELSPVDPDNYGKFFGGDSYVIKYNHGNRWIIYIWQGNTSSNDEKAASAFQAVNLDNELGGRATQIRVCQGHEPKHFLHIFKGKLIVFLGGHASGFKNVKDNDTYVEGETRMYRIRGTTDVDVRAVQVLPKSTSLESDDVFIVENDRNTWLWFGDGSDDVEKELAQGFVDILAPGATAVTIQEGEEPDEFWNALGGKTSYKKSFEEDVQPLSERLFHASLQRNGLLKVEELHQFSQEDLVEEDVMIVDATNQVFIWVGNAAEEEEKKQSIEVAQKYLSKQGRKSTVVLVIKQGEEPDAFTSLFPSWDENLWSSAESYDSIKGRLEEQNNTID